MYVDRDYRERYVFMDMRKEEVETIRRALLAFRTGMVHDRMPTGSGSDSDPHVQYECAGKILRHIEKSL